MMLFQFAETKCIFKILQILHKGKSKYSIMFKKTKISHTTLQTTLKNLLEKKFIKKDNIGHMNVNYTITDKGKKLLIKLEELKKILT